MATYSTADGLQIGEMRIDLQEMYDLLTEEAKDVAESIKRGEAEQQPADFLDGLREDLHKLQSATQSILLARQLLTDF